MTPTYRGCSERSRLVRIGKIERPHGVRGLVLLRPDWKESLSLRPKISAFIDEAQFTIKTVKKGSKGIILGFEGIEDRNMAEKLRGKVLSILRSDLPPLDDDEFYYDDIIGLDVYLLDGSRVGKVKTMFHAATDILVIEGKFGEVMVPVVDIFVAKMGPDCVVLTQESIAELME